jgi:hypothetical protein
MNYGFSKTTKHERITISNALGCAILDLEDAEKLLDTIREDFFADAKRAAPSMCEVEWADSMIRIVSNILGEAITEFHLIAGHYDEPRAACYLTGAKTLMTARKCEEAHQTIFERENQLPYDQRKAVSEARGKLADLDDEQAIPLLESMLKNSWRRDNG